VITGSVTEEVVPLVISEVCEASPVDDEPDSLELFFMLTEMHIAITAPHISAATQKRITSFLLFLFKYGHRLSRNM